MWLLTDRELVVSDPEFGALLAYKITPANRETTPTP